MGKIRIISGKLKSRLISFSDGIKHLRPTHDRVREDLFNWLMFDIEGKDCLDLFAGSGAIGFEAISRNAKSITMLELNKIAYNDIIKNKILLNCDNLEIIHGDAVSYLKQSKRVFDIIFMDPPYDSELLNNSLEIVLSNKNLYKDTLIYIETNKNIDFADFNIIKDKKTSNIYYKLIKLK